MKASKEEMPEVVKETMEKYPFYCSILCLRTNQFSICGGVDSWVSKLDTVIEIYSYGHLVYLNGKWAKRFKYSNHPEYKDNCTYLLLK